MIIIVTSAELETLNDLRTKEYLQTVKWLQENSKKNNVLWLECVSNKIDYLQDIFPVYYSNCHNPYYYNKGANLGNAIKKLFNQYDVSNDLVVQMTGRYHFTDTYFFDTIEKNSGYDLYAKDDGNDQYFTGCFALKGKYFIDWVNQTDWDMLNDQMINIEKSLWVYSKTRNLKSYEFDSIHMKCNIFGNGECQVVYF